MSCDFLYILKITSIHFTYHTELSRQLNILEFVKLPNSLTKISQNHLKDLELGSHHFWALSFECKVLH